MEALCWGSLPSSPFASTRLLKRQGIGILLERANCLKSDFGLSGHDSL